MLESAKSRLAERLGEACGHDVEAESTAELMRLEESLTEAAVAAKQAVSLRRRLRTGHGTSDHADSASAPQPPEPAVSAAEQQASQLAETTDVSEGQRAALPDGQPQAVTTEGESAVRDFVDGHGRSWRVWAVTQDQLQPERLLADRMGDYREGWLAFESTQDGERRRLPHFPRNWQRLSNLDLEGLLRRAESARRRRGAGEESDTTPA